VILNSLVHQELIQRKLVADFSRFSGRLGILGGSFDPIHSMHLGICSDLLGKVVDNVVFIPAAQNPLKVNRPTADNDRLAMLLLAVEQYENFFVSAIELERGGSSYTVETFRQLRLLVKPEVELVLIVGSDCLQQLKSWFAIEELFTLARIVVVQRDEEKGLHQWQAEIAALPLSAAARQKLKDNFQLREVNQVSSTKIRGAKAGNICLADLPAVVAQYITSRGLYQSMHTSV
jgi:nicotinate-nucleotide adenylyltransferase